MNVKEEKEFLLRVIHSSEEFHSLETLRRLANQSLRFHLFPSLALHYTTSADNDFVDVYQWRDGAYQNSFTHEFWPAASIPGEGQLLLVRSGGLVVWDQEKGFKVLLEKLPFDVDSWTVVPAGNSQEEKRYHLVLGTGSTLCPRYHSVAPACGWSETDLDDDPSLILNYDARNLQISVLQKIKFEDVPVVLGRNLFGYLSGRFLVLWEYKRARYKKRKVKLKREASLILIDHSQDWERVNMWLKKWVGWSPATYRRVIILPKGIRSFESRKVGEPAGQGLFAEQYQSNTYVTDEEGKQVEVLPENSSHSEGIFVSKEGQELKFWFLVPVGRKLRALFTFPDQTSTDSYRVFRLLPLKEEREKKVKLVSNLLGIPSSLSGVVVNFCTY